MDDSTLFDAELDRSLAWLLRALRNGDPEIFATSMVEAMDAGATKADIDAVMAHAFQAASAYPPARKPFDPTEISDAFVLVHELRTP